MMRQLPLFSGILPREMIVSDHVAHLQPSLSKMAAGRRNTDIIMALGVDEAFNLIGPSKSTASRQFVIDDITVGYTPKRMHVFKESRQCVCCGRTATVALIERPKHLNETSPHTIGLYIVSGTHFIPLTVDHLLLDCMGGRYDFSNLRTMCLDCNARRSDTMTSREIEQVRNNPTLYLKDRVSVPWLMHVLDLTEEAALVRQMGSRKQIAAKRQELIDARSFLRPGAVPPQIPTVVQEQQLLPQSPRTWRGWWNSMPSIMPMVYGWLADRQHWIMMPQLLFRW